MVCAQRCVVAGVALLGLYINMSPSWHCRSPVLLSLCLDTLFRLSLRVPYSSQTCVVGDLGCNAMIAATLVD